MSVHSFKCKRRHPDAPRDRHAVGHITFELSAGDALSARDRRPLFTRCVSRGMGSELRRLAHRFDEIEAGLADDTQ